MYSAVSKMLTRKSTILVVVTGIFLGALLIASRRLGDMCVDDSYCQKLQQKLPSFGSDSKPITEVVVDDSGKSNGDSHHLDTSLDKLPPAKEPSATHLVLDATSSHSIVAPSQIAPHSSISNGPEATAEPISSSLSPASTSAPEISKPPIDADPACDGFPDTSKVLVVMKTGASEAYGKVPTQIMTNLRCLPEYLIFSDMAQVIAGHTIYDSLDLVLDEVKADNSDFDLYFRQQQCPTDVASCNKFADAASEGWALDKYKNVHIAEKTYRMRPDYDWYLFTDADTYVMWSTLMLWLEHLDASKQLYLGSVAMLGDFPFGHGGSGYLVSKPSMKALFEGQENVANHWDQSASETCCGDFVFAYALKNETGIEVENMWPTINGEKPHTLAYAENQWCHPIVTMHHIGAEEVSDFDAFEQERNFSRPILIKDIYHKFIEGNLQRFREDWDNQSDDDVYLDPAQGEYEEWEVERVKTDDLSENEKVAHLSFDNCRKQCFEKDECLQFMYHNGICKTSNSIRYGAPTEHKDEPRDQYLSGWCVKKIEKWVREHQDCPAVEFPMPRDE